MPKKTSRSVRITCRLTPEENAVLRTLAKRKGFGGSVSCVIRNLLRCRLSVIRDIMQSMNTPQDEIGAEISQMFRTYEDDGMDMSWPSDVNHRT